MNQVTVYWVSSDVHFLDAIFNGVAMVCSNNSLIWGFAIIAALWLIISATTAASIAGMSAGQGGAVLGKGSVNALMPLVFAFMLTAPPLQTEVHIESTINGQFSIVNHVPFVIAVVPAGASLLSKELGSVVETAFQGTGTDYTQISASHQGFINPLKVMLTTRSAMMRLGSIDSDVRSVVSSCIANDTGVDFASVQQKVIAAAGTPVSGSGGATSNLTYPIGNTLGTALGALLYQAGLNTSSFVPDIKLAAEPDTILNCEDAAVEVANRITTTLSGADFSRVVMGATNGVGEPATGANYTIENVQANFSAIREARAGISALAGATVQANAETLNLLFSEMVWNNLNCLKADGQNKTMCMAAAVQANEFERANIQSAAAVVPLLKYTGAFANYMLALVIALGPAIMMLAMFSGVSATKCALTTVHIILWPMLVMNVGAEIVNGMIYRTLASFFESLTQGGWLTQNLTVEAYKEMSLQIGVASHLMASLPVLMSIIFGLGASSAMTSVATSMLPKESATADSAAPQMLQATPLVGQSSTGQITHGVGGAETKTTGAFPAVAADASFHDAQNSVRSQLQSSLQRQATTTQAVNQLRNFENAHSKGNYSEFGMSKDEGEKLYSSYQENLRASQSARTGVHGQTGSEAARTHDVNKQDSTSSKVGGGIRLGAGAASKEGGGSTLPLSVGFNVDAGVEKTTSKTEGAGQRNSTTASSANTGARDEVADKSQALTDAIDKHKSSGTFSRSGNRADQTLRDLESTQKSYQASVAETKSNSETQSSENAATNRFVAFNAKVSAAEIGNATSANANYQWFQQSEQAAAFDAVSGKYQNQVGADMGSGAISNYAGSKAGQKAVVRHAAAVKMANDPSSSTSEKESALTYLTNSMGSLTGMKPLEMPKPIVDHSIAAPKNETGIKPQNLESKAKQISSTALNKQGKSALTTDAKSPTIDKKLQVSREKLVQATDATNKEATKVIGQAATRVSNQSK